MAANALTRLSRRTPLRVKLITALLALVALALAIISFTSTAVFQGYLPPRADPQLAGVMTSTKDALEGNGVGGDNQPQSFPNPGWVIEALDPSGIHLHFGGMGLSTGSPPKLPTSTAWL